MINFKSIAAKLIRYGARKPLAVGPVNVGWSKQNDQEEFTLTTTDYREGEEGGKGYSYTMRIGPKEAVDFAAFVARVITQQERESGTPGVTSFERKREPEEALRELADLIEKNGGNL